MSPSDIPPDGTQRPSKSRMSAGTKILVVVGIAFLLLTVLPCGVLILFDWFWRSFFRDLNIFP